MAVSLFICPAELHPNLTSGNNLKAVGMESIFLIADATLRSPRFQPDTSGSFLGGRVTAGVTCGFASTEGASAHHHSVM
jgi:hypothetical protein